LCRGHRFTPQFCYPLEKIVYETGLIGFAFGMWLSTQE
jgi:hypothetical protein